PRGPAGLTVRRPARARCAGLGHGTPASGRVVALSVVLDVALVAAAPEDELGAAPAAQRALSLLTGVWQVEPSVCRVAVEVPVVGAALVKPSAIPAPGPVHLAWRGVGCGDGGPGVGVRIETRGPGLGRVATVGAAPDQDSR